MDTMMFVIHNSYPPSTRYVQLSLFSRRADSSVGTKVFCRVSLLQSLPKFHYTCFSQIYYKPPSRPSSYQVTMVSSVQFSKCFKVVLLYLYFVTLVYSVSVQFHKGGVHSSPGRHCTIHNKEALPLCKYGLMQQVMIKVQSK